MSLIVGTGAATPQAPTWDRYMQDAEKAVEEKKYGRAEDFFRKATKEAEKSSGEGERLSRSLIRLADVSLLQGKRGTAESHYKRALAVQEKTLGPASLDVAVTHLRLARLYSVTFSPVVLTRSINLPMVIIQAVPIAPLAGAPIPNQFQAVGPLSAGDLGPTFGVSVGLRPDFIRAEPHLLRALGILEKVLGPDHRDVTYTLNETAINYRRQGQYAKAEPYANRVIQIFESIPGSNPRDLGASYNNLAEIYRHQGKYKEAEPYYQRAISILEKNNPDDPGLARVLVNYADLLRRTGRKPEANLVEERANAIRAQAKKQ